MAALSVSMKRQPTGLGAEISDKDDCGAGYIVCAGTSQEKNNI